MVITRDLLTVLTGIEKLSSEEKEEVANLTRQYIDNPAMANALLEEYIGKLKQDIVFGPSPYNCPCCGK